MRGIISFLSQRMVLSPACTSAKIMAESRGDAIDAFEIRLTAAPQFRHKANHAKRLSQLALPLGEIFCSAVAAAGLSRNVNEGCVKCRSVQARRRPATRFAFIFAALQEDEKTSERNGADSQPIPIS
jgi:hypothetical protein